MINFLLLGAVILAGAAGDVSVAHGMRRIGEINRFNLIALVRLAVRIAKNKYIGLGIFWKAVAFFTFIALLARADLSWVAPATAISFVVETLAARYLLHEHVSTTRWAGASIVCLGVALISL